MHLRIMRPAPAHYFTTGMSGIWPGGHAWDLNFSPVQQLRMAGGRLGEAGKAGKALSQSCFSTVSASFSTVSVQPGQCFGSRARGEQGGSMCVVVK